MPLISGAPVANVQFIQLLHGLQSDRGVYDDRLHPGPLSEFRHDVTQAGVDTTAVGPGSSSAGLEDFISFHANRAPGAFELGPYGIEGNGVDDHAFAKPSDGVHLSVENNWQTPPFSTRQGTDRFAPVHRWVAGVQRWDLGARAAGQSVGLDVLLSIRTGTRVTSGTTVSGGCNGGARVPGGFDYAFEDVTGDGSCFGDYSRADADEIAFRVEQREFGPFTFQTPGWPAQIWRMRFSGSYSGDVNLNLSYAATLLPPGFDENALCLYQFVRGTWQKVAGTVDPARHTIAVTTAELSTFAPGAEALVTFTIPAMVSPPNSGTVTGAGPYAIVSIEPNHTFTVTGDRALVAKFKPVYAMTVSAEPLEGGEVEADPFYEAGELAKLKAKPNAGWSFVNWTQNGTPVSTATNFQFTVTGARELVGHFARGHRIEVTAEPSNGGTVSGGGVYGAGEPVNLQADALPGYVFLNWTEAGEPVSDSASFSFSSTASRVLVARFVAQPALSFAMTAPGVVTFSWPAGATDWILQECPAVGPGDWGDSPRPVTVVGSQKQVNLTAAPGNLFFRLIRP